MSSEAALLAEIERLSGAIDRHKTKPPYVPQSRNTYINPTYPNRKYINPAVANKKYVVPATASTSRGPDVSSNQPNASQELLVNGVVFESSTRKLIRKEPTANKTDVAPSHTFSRPSSTYVRKAGALMTVNRIHKPRFSKRKILAGRNNMVLDNIKGTRTGNVSKRRKVDKQCRFFTMTGVCQRGLTCPYQHDPEKIAICPKFLTQSCPNTPDICQLSHDPTPARVPLCHHFQNHGRCTREDCPYPHVRVGPRDGVCRDFAVLGYCENGIDCGKQHVRECPDFAEKSTCPNRGCKLPHVIRANRKRQSASSAQTPTSSSNALTQSWNKDVYSTTLLGGRSTSSSESTGVGVAEDYIALTFEESDEEASEVSLEGSDDESDEELEVETSDSLGTTN